MQAQNILLTINGRNNTRAAFQQVQSQARQTASAVGDAFGVVGNSFKTVGKTMTAAITAPIAGILVSSIKTTAEFEAKMSEVKAVARASAEEMQELTAKAKEMGEMTKFKASEAADAFRYMSMAGWKTKDMINGIEGVMNLAAASGEDLALVSDIVTDAMSAFGMKAEEAGRFADVLASASSNANTNVAMMGETFKYVAPVAGTLKMSIEDTAIASGLLANFGTKASQAGTSLRSAFNRMAGGSATVTKTMKKLGLSLDDGKGNAKSFKEVMDDLRRTFGKLSDIEKMQYGSKIFGVQAVSGMLAIINTTEEDYNKLVSAVYSSSDGLGDAAEMSATMIDNVQGAVTILGSKIEAIQLKIGEKMLPTLRELIDFLQGVADKINAMNPKTLDLIVKIGLVVAAIGPMIWIFGSLITNTIAIVKFVMMFASAIKFLTTTFTLLRIAMTATGAASALFNPWIYVIGAIIAAVIALTVICVKNWDKIKKCWSDLCGWIGKQWNKLCNSDFAKKLGIDKILKTVGDTLKNFKWYDFFYPIGATKILDAIVKQISGGTGIFDALKIVGEKIKNGFIKVWNGIKEFFSNAIEGLKFLGLIFITPFVYAWNKIKEIIDKIKLLFMALVAIVWHIGEAIGEKFVKPIINSIKGLVNKIKNVFRPILTFVRNLIKNIKDVFTTGFNFIKGKIVDGLLGAVSKVYNKIKGFYQKIIDFIRIIMSIVDNFKQGFQNIMEKISEVFTNIYNQYTAFVENFKNFIAGIKKDFVDFVNAIINGINHLTSGINALKIHVPGVEELGIPDIDIGFNIAQIENLPSLSIGTEKVLSDGLAIIHKGEAVVPAKVNPWNNNVVAKNRDNRIIVEVEITDNRKDQDVNLNIDGRKIAEAVLKKANVMAKCRA